MLVACRRPKRTVGIHGSGNIYYLGTCRTVQYYILFIVNMLNSLCFAPLIGMHVCPTWDEQFGRQRIRFRRTCSISEYVSRYPYQLTNKLVCIKRYCLQLALGGTEALYIVKAFSNPMRLSLGSAVSSSESAPGTSLFLSFLPAKI